MARPATRQGTEGQAGVSSQVRLCVARDVMGCCWRVGASVSEGGDSRSAGQPAALRGKRARDFLDRSSCLD